MARRDLRSPEAAEYRRLYRTSRWLARRKHQLQAEPLCRICQAMGIVTVATVADHVEPHKGDRALFFGGPLQSLCAEHHSGAKQQAEAAGRRVTVTGADGWPVEV